MSYLFTEYKNQRQQVWSNLNGSSVSLALSELLQKQNHSLCIITKDALSAQKCIDELKFFLPEKEHSSIIYFPDWEILPYDHFSPHQDIISQRIRTLYKIIHTPKLCIVGTATSFMHKICPRDFIQKNSTILKIEDKIHIENFRKNLIDTGYINVQTVMEHGEFAIRGSIIDLFPMGSKLPYRIELLDDTICTLRIFDPETQKTIDKINSINILPAKEFPFTKDAITVFRQNFREAFPGNPSLCPLYEAISNNKFYNGIEYYIPLFFEEMSDIFAFLPQDTIFFLEKDIRLKIHDFWSDVSTRFEQKKHNINMPILSPDKCFLSEEIFLQKLNQNSKIEHVENSNKKNIIEFTTKVSPSFLIQRNQKEPLQELVANIKNTKTLLITESAGRKAVLLDLLKTSQIFPKNQNNWQDFINDIEPINIIVGPLTDGFELPKSHILILTENNIFGENAILQRKTNKKNIDPDLVFKHLAEIKLNDPVVHLQFGVGRYIGLTTIETDGIINEFLILEYANKDKIYVPVTALHQINRYRGKESPPLHKLGSQQWELEKKKAKEKAHDIAVALLETYAKRNMAHAKSCILKNDEYQRFVSGFPYIETTDQTNVITQILHDLSANKPMDRLICGDVGFGKTEVAMRACYIAALSNLQTCVLVPTTLLAQQHYTSFQNRFADFPVTIDFLSRVRTKKESTEIIKKFQNGQIDILIGTHKILTKELHTKNLGLLVVDEEHRFGVQQKEYIKSLRSHIHILSMTATPIPRTLNMALAGLRDISLITTPPNNRLAIKTFWHEKNDSIAKEAIFREIYRGGQIFLLHNNIQSIYLRQEEIQKLMPEARIAVAHGQMPEHILEKIMSDFYHHKFDILICTTIIETGIDIPNANTIIIDNAQDFGLAQLHQLRGRVGRSHHQAYAYLFTPNEELLTYDATKRLKAIISFEALGAGFILATHDLEIRGTGELLGDNQSGQMEGVGLQLFTELIEKAVDDLKKGTYDKNAILEACEYPEVDLGISALIPELYVADLHIRLSLYKRIASAYDTKQLNAIKIECIDRFGNLPESLINLFEITQLKYIAKLVGIKKIYMRREKAYIEFSKEPKIDGAKIIKLIQTQSSVYQLEGQYKLKFTCKDNNIKTIQTVVANIIDKEVDLSDFNI